MAEKEAEQLKFKVVDPNGRTIVEPSGAVVVPPQQPEKTLGELLCEEETTEAAREKPATPRPIKELIIAILTVNLVVAVVEPFVLGFIAKSELYFLIKYRQPADLLYGLLALSTAIIWGSWPQRIIGAMQRARGLRSAATSVWQTWLGSLPYFLYIGVFGILAAALPVITLGDYRATVGPRAIIEILAVLAATLQLPFYFRYQKKFCQSINEELAAVSQSTNNPLPSLLGPSAVKLWLSTTSILAVLAPLNSYPANIPFSLLGPFPLSMVGFLATFLLMLIQLPFYSYLSGFVKAEVSKIGKPRKDARGFIAADKASADDFVLAYREFAPLERW